MANAIGCCFLVQGLHCREYARVIKLKAKYLTPSCFIVIFPTRFDYCIFTLKKLSYLKLPFRGISYL